MTETESEISERKTRIRTEVRRHRTARSEDERAETAIGIFDRMREVASYYGARTVACYESVPSEPNTLAFRRWARENGIRVLLPETREDGLLDWLVDGSDEELSPNALIDAQLVFAPACSAAPNGVRLGWGRGYYDRCLGSMENRPPTYAVVFEADLRDDIPQEEHDQLVDGIVTEARIITIDREMPVLP